MLVVTPDKEPNVQLVPSVEVANRRLLVTATNLPLPPGVP